MEWWTGWRHPQETLRQELSRGGGEGERGRGTAAHVEARPRTRVWKTWKAPQTATGGAEPPSEIIQEEEGALALARARAQAVIAHSTQKGLN